MLIDNVTAPVAKDNGTSQGYATALDVIGNAELMTTIPELDVVTEIDANVEPSTTPDTLKEIAH